MSGSDRPDPTPANPPVSIQSLGRLGDVIAALGALEPIAGGQPGAAEPSVRTFGRFRLRKVLGKGKFGIVFLADDPQTNRAVALKLPQLALLTDPALADRFRRDVEALAPLDHLGIVPVLEAGAVAGVAYLAMPYVEGPTLAAVICHHHGGVAAGAAVGLVIALADAVQHAHERGVLHCDLKPANVLLASQSARGPTVQGPTVREGAAPAACALPDGRALDLMPRIIDFG